MPKRGKNQASATGSRKKVKFRETPETPATSDAPVKSDRRGEADDKALRERLAFLKAQLEVQLAEEAKENAEKEARRRAEMEELSARVIQALFAHRRSLAKELGFTTPERPTRDDAMEIEEVTGVGMIWKKPSTGGTDAMAR